MKKYVIVSDSCCDLNKQQREKYGIEYIPMHFTFEGKDMVASLDWEEVSAQEFYGAMRKGGRNTTSQVNASQYKEAFEAYLSAGYDILSISCSSALSNSVKASYQVRDELKEKYPDAKIVCIDSLIACIGLGMLCIRASELRAAGNSIEETAAWIEEHKMTVHQECTVEKLTYLKQAGRVSAASAFFGGLLNVKPIIISDASGRNAAVEKVKGRGASLARLVERFKEEYLPCEYQRIFIAHADCLEDAEKVREAVWEALGDKNAEIPIGYIGPVVGSTVGPGTIGIYFYGKEVTYDCNKK